MTNLDRLKALLEKAEDGSVEYTRGSSKVRIYIEGKDFFDDISPAEFAELNETFEKKWRK